MNNPFLLALFCGFALLSLIFGLSTFYIEQQFSYLASVFTVIGGITFFILLSLIIKHSSGRVKSPGLNRIFSLKRWKKLAIILGIVAGSVTFIGLSHYFANQSNVRWDVTQDKQHTLSNHTLDYVSTLTT